MGQAHPVGLPFIKEVSIVLEYEFIKKMGERNGCSAEAARHWIEFAKENVNVGQFVDFKPAGNEKGVQDWLSSIYAACYFARQRGGDELIHAVYQAASVPHCLYPHEIIGSIGYMREGGDLEQLVERSLEGALDYDGKLPVLADVENDLKNQRKKNRDVR